MKILEVQNPQYADSSNTNINLEVKFEEIKENGVSVFIPFTASLNDTEQHGIDLYNNAINGDYGSISAYVAPVEPTPTPEQIEAHKAIYRELKIFEGTTVSGITVEGDDKTQLRLAGARIEAEADPLYSVDWAATSGKVTLNAVQVIAVSSALRQHIQKCFDAYFDIETTTYNSIIEVETAFDAAYST